MKLITALNTILLFVVFFFSNVYGQENFNVNITSNINIDYYSTVSLNPNTVEIGQPSIVTVRVLSPSNTGISGRSVIIYSSGLNITQPTVSTDSTGKSIGSVYSNITGTYSVCAKDITFGYDILIQNCSTLYVVPVAIPSFSSEPYYTKGITNTLQWNNLGAGYQYFLEVSDVSTFDTVMSNSGWISNTSFQVNDLEDSKMYFYRVKAKNPYGGMSEWSSTVFSVQDNIPPTINELSIGGVGSNNTTVWNPEYIVKMIFRVKDNLKLDIADFLCVNQSGNTYSCVTEYSMEGDNLVVNIRLKELELISNLYLREKYEFCVEAKDVAGNITRVCNIYFTVPKGEPVSTASPVIETINKVVENVTKALEGSVGQLDSDDLERVSTTGSIVTASTAVAISVGSLSNLPYLILQFIFSILSWFGFRVGSKPLGYVYDSITKNPISQAIVRIYDTNGKIVWSDVTNSKGYFFARLNEGRYKILVRAGEYTFPSTIIYGKDDFPLTNIYHGGEFDITSDSELNFSIPLDPAEISKVRVWWEIIWGRFKNVINILHILLFVVGLIFAIYMFNRNPYWLTVLVLMLYIPSSFFTIRNIFVKKERYGLVKDLDGNRIEGIAIVLKEIEFDKVVQKRVSDRLGRYRMLIDSGKYYLEVMDTGYRVESIEMGSGISALRDGEWVDRDIVVSKIERG